MRITVLALLIAGASLAQDKSSSESSDVQRAIAFERYKDMASARQARKEAKNPSVPVPSPGARANRESGMADPGEPQWQQHQKATQKK